MIHVEPSGNTTGGPGFLERNAVLVGRKGRRNLSGVPIPALVALLYLGLQRLIWLPVQAAGWLYSPPHLAAATESVAAWHDLAVSLTVVHALFIAWLVSSLLPPRENGFLQWLRDVATIGTALLIVLLHMTLMRVLPA